ncbi:MAG: tyrosine-type recombinase/integrase [Candidatus Baldrarchaeia archaeon]
MYADLVRYAKLPEKVLYINLKTRGGKKYKLLVSNFVKIRNFLNAYERKGASINTLEKYAENLLELFGKVHVDKDASKIKIEDFEAFWDWKVQENRKREKRKGQGIGRYTQKFSTSTVNSILACFKSFFLYIGREDLLPQLKQIAPRIQKWQPPEIREADIKPLLKKEFIRQVLDFPERRQPVDEFYVDRLHLLVLFLYSTGMRISEVANLKVSDLRLDRKVPQAEIVGKGNKPRVVPLSPTWVKLYQDFVKRYRVKSDYVFCSKTGAKLSKDTLREYFRRLAIAQGKSFGPHIMRHKYAMDLVASEGDLPKAMKILGHASLHTLSGYVSRIEKKKLQLKEDPLKNLA